MNIARKIYPITRQSLNKTYARKFRFSAANHTDTKPAMQEEKFDFEDLKVLERVYRKKPPIEPFMKNVFQSKFDRDLLAYPEILNKDERTDLDRRVERLDQIFRDSEKTKEDRHSILSQHRMYLAPVNLTNNGHAMISTERMQYLETISSDLDLAKDLSDHWVGIEALESGLPKDEYEKLLADLNGKHLIRLCTRETISTRPAQSDFRTRAVLDVNDVYMINGVKVAQKADGYLIVLALAENDKLKAFLVKPNATGVSFDNHKVVFRNTPGIPLNEISEEKLSMILCKTRLDTAIICQGHLRRAVKDSISHIRGKYAMNEPLSELSSVRTRVGACVSTIYALESACYYTAGLLDGYEAPDVDLEIAMCRFFASLEGIPDLMSLLSLPGYLSFDETDKLLKDYRNLLYRDEIDDNVGSFIALNGLHHVGKSIADEVAKVRNPVMFPMFVLKKAFAMRHQTKDNPKLDLYLSHNLHPTLQNASELLEYCVLRMRYASECLMSRYGVDIQGAYIDLNRLAEAGTYVFVMSAALARASRSYCIGVRNAEIEMKIASAIVQKLHLKVKRLILDLDEGEYLNLDYVKTDLGKKVLESKSLIYEKPYERVWY